MLADGTKVSQKSMISKEGIWPLYVPLYKGGGSLLGWIQFASGSVGGGSVWVKSHDGISKYYPRGFTNAVETTGSLYTPPSSGKRAMELSTGGMVFSDGGLSGPFTIAITMGLNNKVTPSNGGKLSVSIDTASGLFKGTTVIPGTTTPLPFQGVLLEDENTGAGFFLTSAKSGRVFLSPTP